MWIEDNWQTAIPDWLYRLMGSNVRRGRTFELLTPMSVTLPVSGEIKV